MSNRLNETCQVLIPPLRAVKLRAFCCLTSRPECKIRAVRACWKLRRSGQIAIKSFFALNDLLPMVCLALRFDEPLLSDVLARSPSILARFTACSPFQRKLQCIECGLEFTHLTSQIPKRTNFFPFRCLPGFTRRQTVAAQLHKADLVHRICEETRRDGRLMRLAV